MGKQEVIIKYNAGTGLTVTFIQTVVCRHNVDNKYNTCTGYIVTIIQLWVSMR